MPRGFVRRMQRGGILVVGACLGVFGCATGSTGVGPGRQPVPFVRTLPETSEYVRLLAPPESVVMRSGLVTLRPGEDCGWHSTDHHEELIICLEGEGEVRTRPNGRRALAAGCYAYNPPHTEHCVFNTGQRAMRYIYIVAPTEPEPRGGHEHASPPAE